MQEYTWVPFYKELAGRLLGYKDNRAELTRIVYQIYDETGIKMPKMDESGELSDIDPFTFYAIFNKGQSDDTRMILAAKVAEKLGVMVAVPRDFAGIPVANSMNATYYPFGLGRSGDTIDRIWELFEVSHSFYQGDSEEKRARFARAFEYVVGVKYNGVGKVTMGLFWAMPDLFISLDSRNRWYIYESGEVPAEVAEGLPPQDNLNKDLTAREYFEIMDKIREYIARSGRFGSFIDLSQEAWRYSEFINQQNKNKEKDGIGDKDVEVTRYWLYAPGAKAEKWESFYAEGIMGIGWGATGDLNDFETAEEIAEAVRERYDRRDSLKNVKRCLFDFSKVMKPGDVIFVKKGQHGIVGKGIVESEYYYDKNMPEDFNHVRRVEWTHKGDFHHAGQIVMKTLTNITDNTGFVKELEGLFAEEEMDADLVGSEVEKDLESYTEEDFLREVFMDTKEYAKIREIVMRKQNIILQGAPGVGKTFAAKRLAYSIMGVKDPERVALVQFHQSYSYEDFIEGFRPSSENSGFEIRKGVFYEFAERAASDPERPYFFIIDEINRGNLSKIFGELFMLIEKDKRDYPVRLLYSDENFRVPRNLYIIGMMNTADRSLALLDYALRRRFSFYDMEPAFDTEGFVRYKNSVGNPKLDKIVEAAKRINVKIEKDPNLGAGFRIGHSYLLDFGDDVEEGLRGVVTYELLPLLKEYWFDDEESYLEAERLLKEAVL